MPTLLIKTNQPLEAPQQMALLGRCSQATAAMLGKPERYVMVTIEGNVSMLFAGSTAPCAYLELKSLGLPQEQTGAFSQRLCQLVSSELAIPTERIYIEFSTPAPHLWGWDNTTF